MSLPFERLQKLGQERYTQLRNDLMRGKPAMALARMIQSEWKEFIGVSEKTLTQQLLRFKESLIKEGIGSEAKKILNEKGDLKLSHLRGSTISTHDRLIGLANLYEERINMFWNKEKVTGLPLPLLNDILTDYSELLLRLQKVRFDLGLDEYKGLVTAKLTQDRLIAPDGSEAQRLVMEATSRVDEIFRMRGITAPKEIDGIILQKN